MSLFYLRGLLTGTAKLSFWGRLPAFRGITRAGWVFSRIYEEQNAAERGIPRR